MYYYWREQVLLLRFTKHVACDNLDSSFFASSLVKERVDKDRSTSQNTLLISTSSRRKVDLESIGVSEDLRHGTLGFLENLAVKLVTTLVTDFRLVNAEGLLAAALSTRIAFSTTIDANATHASRWVNKVEVVILVIVNLE